MSGGYFEYKQYDISRIADEVEQLIFNNDSTELNEFGNRCSNDYSVDTIAEFKTALELLRKAAIYTQRIDWLVSCDDGEDSFHSRLKDELEKI